MKLQLFLTHQFKHMFWVLKEPSQLEGSFEYPQLKLWFRFFQFPTVSLYESRFVSQNNLL